MIQFSLLFYISLNLWFGAALSLGECPDEFPQFLSPVAMFANRLLNGDHSQPKENRLYGVLLRTADYFGLENITEVLIRHNNVAAAKEPVPPIVNLPSSYLHASMRASGAIYQNVHDKEMNQGDYTLLFGTKFKQNTALKEFQKDDETLDCDYVYLHDAGTVDRGTVFDKSKCNDAAANAAVCVDDECVAHGPGGCGGCKVDPRDFGDLVGRWSELNNQKFEQFYSESCYYETIEEAVIASNSLWTHRRRWYMDAEVPTDYQGYNECATSLNIDNPGMADALVLTLHRTDGSEPQSICHFPNHPWIADRLSLAYEHGYGDLPVIFYRESYGIQQITECVKLFGARDCQDAWHKDFFSQEYIFGGDNTTCLHKPPECDEVYYFPADNEICSAFTDKGKERIERLCREEKNRDVRLAYEILANNPNTAATVSNQEPQVKVSQTGTAKIPTNTQQPQVELSGVQNSARKSKEDIPSSSLVQDPTSTAWFEHVSFFLTGAVVSLLVRKKLPLVLQFE